MVDPLGHAKGLGCQNPRDHVYAFHEHPLLRTNNGEAVIPSDYSIVTTTVFQRLTEWSIKNVGIFALTAIKHDEETISDTNTPFWAIRWELNIIQISFGYYQPFYYNAARRNLEHNIGCITLSAGTSSVVTRVFQFSADDADWSVERAVLALKCTNSLKTRLLLIRKAVMGDSHQQIYDHQACQDALSLTLVFRLRDWKPAKEDIERCR